MKVSHLVREYAVPALYLAGILALIVVIVSRDLPKVGHDYGFFLPRLLDTHLHHKVDGLGIQWYTANFGAGTPAHPNPQYLQYSLPQFLLFLVNPWTALMASLVVYSAIGFAGFYLFLREEMGWIPGASALGASFIVANGFLVEHAIVGHAGFQHFPLLGAIVFLGFSRRFGPVPAGILIGLLVALIVNQAGFVNLVIFILSLAVLLPLIYWMREDLFGRREFLTLLAGGLASLLLSLSKVSAVLAFMRWFPRSVEDEYGQTYLQGLGGILRQLTGFNLLLPYQLLSGRDMEEISHFFLPGAGSQFGFWEMNTALPPGLLFLLALGTGYSIYLIYRKGLRISGKQWTAVLLLGLGVWLVLDMTLAQGWLYEHIKPLPVLRSLHANVRFSAALIFPLALLGALVYHTVFRERRTGNPLAFSLIALSTLGMLGLYLAIPEQVHIRNFNIDSVLPIYARIDTGWNFTVKNIAETTDMEAFRQESSNLATQDPMFGYEGEYFEPKAVPGPVLEIQDGLYNMTNPAGYVFPEENHARPFDLFREEQRTELEQFISHRQPDLEISTWQAFANGTSLVTLVLSLIYLGYRAAKGCLQAWQSNARQDYAHQSRVI